MVVLLKFSLTPLINKPMANPLASPHQSRSRINTIGRVHLRNSNCSVVKVKAFFLNPMEEPIVREALKEPVAFMGGMFAGLLRLDLNDDPLKEWVTRTVEASGVTDEIEGDGLKPEEEEEGPQQIEIE